MVHAPRPAPVLPRTIPSAARESLRILYVAKHARAAGAADREDGSHAVYHAEIRDVLSNLGLNLQVADRYETLFERPDVDFVFALLNRGGFLNSEMMLPLLCSRHGLPCLGGSPIIRGLSDDKHLTKLVARARGLTTADWAIYRRGTVFEPARLPRADRFVIKPNASSASWGVSAADDSAGAEAAVAALHDEGHDAIVEPFITGHDIEVSIVTVHGEPLILPTMIVEQHDPHELRSYAEKRDLDGGRKTYAIRAYRDTTRLPEIEGAARNLMKEFAPFDYGRFECRLDTTTGRINFLEVNLNCNLWSRKTIAMAAALVGWSHSELIETILCESLDRHGLIERAKRQATARPRQLVAA